MIVPLLRSLCITGLAGLLAPTLFIGCTLLLLFALGYVPGLDELSTASKTCLLHFLNIFGNGNSLRGVGTLAVVSCSVAILFDTYTLLATSKPVR